MAQDPDRETLGHILRAWCQQFGSAPTKVGDAVSQASPTLREAMAEVAGDGPAAQTINLRRLGKYLARQRGRIVQGLRFDHGSSATASQRWQVIGASTAAVAAAAAATATGG